MKFFITGGAGFIGSNLADRLLAVGQKVIVYDNFDLFYPEKIKRQNISSALKNKNYTLIEGDILNAEKLYDCLKLHEPDVVIHLAARGGVRQSIELPEIYYRINVTGTLYLLEAMKKANLKKMIFASSSSVYGNNQKIPFSENDKVDYPISPYAASKKAGELLCHTYHHLYGFDIFCLRLFTVYGPRQRPDLAINKFFKAVIEDKPITIYGNGTTKRDYTYIEDVLDGIVSSINKLKGYEIINLGESNTVSLQELIHLTEKTIGKKAVINQAEVQQGDVSLTFADISKARTLLGYNPKTDIKKGVELYYQWLKMGI